jgi:hypothetical protein
MPCWRFERSNVVSPGTLSDSRDFGQVVCCPGADFNNLHHHVEVLR